jgi:hypothetical protein
MRTNISDVEKQFIIEYANANPAATLAQISRHCGRAMSAVFRIVSKANVARTRVYGAKTEKDNWIPAFFEQVWALDAPEPPKPVEVRPLIEREEQPAKRAIAVPRGWKAPRNTISIMWNQKDRFSNPKQARSQKYQYLTNEVIIGQKDEAYDSWWNKIVDEHPIYNDYIAETRDRLYTRVLTLAEEISTERQWEIFSMVIAGRTQQEIADKLALNQSSIYKTIAGNQCGKEMYGGILRKLQYAASIDEECQKLLSEIQELC